MEILRRAFGIEEYSIAKTNAEKLFSWIRLSTKLKSEIINELEELELIFKKVENHRDILNEQLELIKKTIVIKRRTCINFRIDCKKVWFKG